jgi:hypothetical protein
METSNTIPKHVLYQYQKEMKNQILTTRFINATWEENRQFSKQLKYNCFYCSPRQISSKIQENKLCFVFEMNNEKNKIQGIGLIKNKVYHQNLSIYEKGNYNRYSYVGKYRIDRSELNPEEEAWIQQIDDFCFRGKCHLKRGQGFTSFPITILYKYYIEKEVHMIDEISNMFKKRFV